MIYHLFVVLVGIGLALLIAESTGITDAFILSYGQ